MQGTDYYKEKIINLVNSVDDVNALKMIYSLLFKLLAIDDKRILDIAIRFITGITK